MKIDQWKTFLSRKLIQQGTRVYAEVTAKGIADDPVRVMKELSIIDVNESGGLGHFVRDHTENYTFTVDTVKTIDSMTPERLAKAFKIK